MFAKNIIVISMFLLLAQMSHANSDTQTSDNKLEQKSVLMPSSSNSNTTHNVDSLDIYLNPTINQMISPAQFEAELKKRINDIRSSQDAVEKKVRTLYISLLLNINASPLAPEVKIEFFEKLFSNMYYYLRDKVLSTSATERYELVYQVVLDQDSYLEILKQGSVVLQSLFLNQKLIESSLNSSERVDSLTRLASVFSAFKQEVNNVENMNMQNNYAMMLNSGSIDRNNPSAYLNPTQRKQDRAWEYFERFENIIPVMTNSKLSTLENDIIFLSMAIRIDSLLPRSFYFHQLHGVLSAQKMNYNAKAVTLAYVAKNIMEELDEMKSYQNMNSANPQLVSFYSTESAKLKQSLENIFHELQIFDSATFTAEQWNKIESAKKRTQSYIGSSGVASHATNTLLSKLSNIIKKTGICKMNF